MVIVPVGLYLVLLRPVQMLLTWDVVYDQFTGQDHNWPRRPVVHRAGGIAADSAHPAIPVADSVPSAAAYAHSKMLEPVTDAKPARRVRQHGVAIFPCPVTGPLSDKGTKTAPRPGYPGMLTRLCRVKGPRAGTRRPPCRSIKLRPWMVPIRIHVCVQSWHRERAVGA